MGNILKGLMRDLWREFPDNRDPGKWPNPMRRDWADDQGLSTGAKAQEHQIAQFRMLRAALDEFRPDCIVMLYRDMGEPWSAGTGEPGSFRPKYWVHVQEFVRIRPFQPFGNGANYWGADPATETMVPLHPDAAEYMLRQLTRAGRDPSACTEIENRAKLGLGHNCVAGIIHLDWDRRRFDTPIVPVAVDPFGFNRSRTTEGLSAWDKTQVPPLTPREAFELGRQIARVFGESRWRVALVASNGWSSSQNTWRGKGALHPVHPADQTRFAQWENGQIGDWGENWTFDEMEENAQWEMTISIILAGAMTEIGAHVRYADLATNWILNADWVTTIFEPA